MYPIFLVINDLQVILLWLVFSNQSSEEADGECVPIL